MVIPDDAFEFNIPTINGSNFVTNNFLIRNPQCLIVPLGNNMCWLTSGGAIRSRGGLPIFNFSGVVNPGCRGSETGGNFEAVWRPGNLRFRAIDIAVVNCGNLPGLPPGSMAPRTPYNFIDFEGVGTLKSFTGNRTDHGIVRFSARAVDGGQPGRKDRLYLRVFDGADRTLLLISGNPANPLDVAPLNLSSGNQQLHVSGCDN